MRGIVPLHPEQAASEFRSVRSTLVSGTVFPARSREGTACSRAQHAHVWTNTRISRNVVAPIIERRRALKQLRKAKETPTICGKMPSSGW